MKVQSSILGYPRMGPARELKKALERYWSSQNDERPLLQEAARIRAQHWKEQAGAGIDVIPSGDFSFYDHMLDAAAMLGAVPERYGTGDGAVTLPAYFAMARGSQANGRDLPALEMTKWFDTNYHYIVPELAPRQSFRLSFTQVLDHFAEARAQGFHTRPVLPGPVTFLSLAKSASEKSDPLGFLDGMLPVYEEVLKRLSELGADWVQIDEPIMVTDMSDQQVRAMKKSCARLAAASGLKIMLATYFGGLRNNLDTALELPVAGLHLDLVRGPEQADEVLRRRPKSMVISLGVVDGRNIWRSDLDKAVTTAEKFVDTLGADRVLVASSCSLLHCPEDLSRETALDGELKSWLAFSRQKLDELALIARAAGSGRARVSAELEENKRIRAARAGSSRTVNNKVRERMAAFTLAMARRPTAHAERRKLQAAALHTPLFPTTTIGSFPQTQEVRNARAELRSGAMTQAQYESFLEKEIERTVRIQEELGLDVLVHGESERNDMVEYFGEMLSGFAFTRNGWVQSYGSRCVKPPIIFGDVERPVPMTVRWSSYAQSLTTRTMKGMLTGPVTILQWSFVRDDQPRSLTCRQIAFAIRDEVRDLESAGIKAIQIDEPALREGLPLRRSEWDQYLAWAVEAFRVTSSGVRDSTQIHSHMCYSEFNDIVPSIAAMDADVLSVESARSRMELLGAFRDFRYPNEIGPGVYDIHSPRVPSEKEIEDLLEKALQVLGPEQLWVNPDCGLKTRQWKEVRPALAAMVEAARRLRARHTAESDGAPHAGGRAPARA
jgi:5-methyltetrahydropteroyltriglutamate--homocysteine methyltransferase